MPLIDLPIIDPYAITDDQCPVFIQSADTRSFLAWGIRERTKSNWNHSMVLYKKGRVVSQGWFLKEIDIGEYMKPGGLLKFWICGDITTKERTAIMFKIAARLKLPKLRRRYDVLGIVGQFFGLRWFNIPWLNYCSEFIRTLVLVLFADVRGEPTPEDIDSLFKSKDRMKLLGYYINV